MLKIGKNANKMALKKIKHKKMDNYGLFLELNYRPKGANLYD